jgi:hypothetical protein
MALMAGCEKSDVNEWSTVQSIECHNGFEPTEVYLNNISEGCHAYEKALSHFTTADGKYTDDFGGVFVDKNGIYNINVVGMRRPVRSKYIKYRKVKNSYNFFLEVSEEVKEIMKEPEYTVWLADVVCETCNKALICLEDGTKIPDIVARLKEKGLFRKDSLNFYVGSDRFELK